MILSPRLAVGRIVGWAVDVANVYREMDLLRGGRTELNKKAHATTVLILRKCLHGINSYF